MAYELKKSEELEAMEKQKEKEKELYGDKEWSPEETLPVIKDMGAVTPESTKISSSTRGVIYKIIGGIFILALGFAFYLMAKYLIFSSGDDITNYLSLSEMEISDTLGIDFEQHDELAKSVQQYSGGTVTVRAGKGLQVVYIDGKQVGVSTDSRDWRFFGIGINDSEKDAIEKMTYQSEGSFTVLNDMLGGSSNSYYYYDTTKNTCFVLTINSKSNRVAYMAYYTDFKTISKDLSF